MLGLGFSKQVRNVKMIKMPILVAVAPIKKT